MYSTAFDICYKYEFVVVSTHGLITSFNLNVDASKIVFFRCSTNFKAKTNSLFSYSLSYYRSLSLSLSDPFHLLFASLSRYSILSSRERTCSKFSEYENAILPESEYFRFLL
uniref:(northern house mosquito) hypothetical protein n=1 Tax=Culex pipiens TaxID=7175 RepID=A0A8D8FUY6_CULPI